MDFIVGALGIATILIVLGTSLWQLRKNREFNARRERMAEDLDQLQISAEKRGEEIQELCDLVAQTMVKELEVSKALRELLKEIYQELRKAEWGGQSLADCITILEQQHPWLRETDEQLEAGELVGAE